MARSRPGIKELYEMGFSLRETARMSGLPMSTVRERLLAYGVEMRKRGGVVGTSNLSHSEYQRTAYMYTELGMSTTEIGEVLGRTHDTINNRLRRHGVQIRTGAESVRLRWERKPKTRSRRKVPINA